MPLTLHTHIARRLIIPVRATARRRRTPYGERLAWRLVALVSELVRVEPWRVR